jgi:acyl-CoA thioesterase
VRWVGPSAIRPDGTRGATHRHWFRLPRPLDDDPHLHTALLGYATDWTGVSGRPLHLEGDTTCMINLDHSAWFHRPARAGSASVQDSALASSKRRSRRHRASDWEDVGDNVEPSPRPQPADRRPTLCLP